MLTPLGCMYTPLGAPGLVSTSQIIKCSLCSHIINSFVKIDRQNGMWWCPFCTKMTFFPDWFELPEKGAGDSDIPPEIRPSPHNTVDYILPADITASSAQPQYVAAYVIDIYQHTDTIELGEFAALKNSIADSMKNLPPDTLVLVITFGKSVEVHRVDDNTSVAFLPEQLFPEKYDFAKLFKDKSLTEKLLSKLQLAGKPSTSLDSLPLHESGYLVSNLENLHNYIRGLRPKLTHSFKPARATGLAVLLATLLLSCSSFSGLTGKVSLFCSGPATSNPGKIVEETGSLRSHHDVANFNAPHFVSASKFYQTLAYVSVGYKWTDASNAVYSSSGKIVDYAVEARSPKFSFDIYTGSLDQVGVYEMKSLASSGSGNIVLTDGFQSPRFHQQLLDNTSAIITEKHNSQLMVTTSTGLKVMKVISTGTELQSSYQSEKHSNLHHEKISDTVTQFDSTMKKRCFTNQWYLGSLNEHDTVAVYFEPETVGSSSMLNEDFGIKEMFVQFQTKFFDLESGNFVLRVTTIRKPTTLSILAENKVKLSNHTYRLVNTKSSILKEKALIETFDYKAWMVLLTRLLISKIDTTIGYENFDEVVNDVDSALIRLTRFFGGLKVESRSTQNPLDALNLVYSISENFRELPALSYSLRRNPQLIRIFNSSPDETAYYHHMFSKSATDISCVMIQPTLYKLLNNGELSEITLDITSLDEQANQPAYYILDSVFNVIIYYQVNDSASKLPLHNLNNDDLIYGSKIPESLAEVLNIVKKKIVKDRSVTPTIVLTQSGHSQARFLLARLYPVFDKIEKETVVEPKWWNFFADRTPNQNYITDDVSVAKYHDELLEKVQKYKIESDY